MFINCLIMVAAVFSGITANVDDKFIYNEASLNKTTVNDKFIYMVASLNQTNPVVINVSVYLIKLDGVLAYILTTQQNSKYHSIIMEFVGQRNIHISFNEVKKITNISSFCGCSTCTRTTLQFIVSYSPSSIEFWCNGNRSITFDRNSYVPHNFNSNIYPFPTKWSGEQKIFAWIGNIGPFTGANKKTWFPLPSQLKACIKHLQIGDEKYLATSNHSRCGADVCGSMPCILLGGTDVVIPTKYHHVTKSIKYSSTTETSTPTSQTTTSVSTASPNGPNIHLIITTCGLAMLFVVITSSIVMMYRIRSGLTENRIQSIIMNQLANHNVPHVQPAERNNLETTESGMGQREGYDYIGQPYWMPDEVVEVYFDDVPPPIVPKPF